MTQDAKIDAAAKHLRETLQAGKKLTPWEITPKATKKKWLTLAEGTLRAAISLSALQDGEAIEGCDCVSMETCNCVDRTSYGKKVAALAQDTDATPPVAPTGMVGIQTEALRAFAESFHFTVTDSFYKDAYLGIHEPDSVTIRLVNNSLESAHIAKLEARRKAALAAPAGEGEVPRAD